MKRKILECFLLSILGLFLSAVHLYGQNKVKVSGVVTSSDDSLPLVGVAVMSSPGNGVITSLDGDYAIEVAPGTQLTFSCIGFLDETIVVPDS